MIESLSGKARDGGNASQVQSMVSSTSLELKGQRLETSNQASKRDSSMLSSSCSILELLSIVLFSSLRCENEGRTIAVEEPSKGVDCRL
jgi:hypothetical protein